MPAMIEDTFIIELNNNVRQTTTTESNDNAKIIRLCETLT